MRNYDRLTNKKPSLSVALCACRSLLKRHAVRRMTRSFQLYYVFCTAGRSVDVGVVTMLYVQAVAAYMQLGRLRTWDRFEREGRRAGGGNPRSDPSSMGESFFFPLYQARKYVLTSWYCNSFCPRVVNPSAGKGSPEGDANVRQYVRGQ
jgi:hypothetical protein